MRCPFCIHGDSKVIDSRDIGQEVRRRRRCLACGRRFTTYERVQTGVLQVVKRDGRREDFSRDKLLASVRKACAKRPLAMGTIEKLVEGIEARLVGLGRAEVPSQSIGEMVMEGLRQLDRVAYVRFASVYRDFRDIETFREEIDALLGPAQPSPSQSRDQLSLPGLEQETLVVPLRPRGRPRRAVQPGPGD